MIFLVFFTFLILSLFSFLLLLFSFLSDNQKILLSHILMIFCILLCFVDEPAVHLTKHTFFLVSTWHYLFSMFLLFMFHDFTCCNKTFFTIVACYLRLCKYQQVSWSKLQLPKRKYLQVVLFL